MNFNFSEEQLMIAQIARPSVELPQIEVAAASRANKHNMTTIGAPGGREARRLVAQQRRRLGHPSKYAGRTQWSTMQIAAKKFLRHVAIAT